MAYPIGRWFWQLRATWKEIHWGRPDWLLSQLCIFEHSWGCSDVIANLLLIAFLGSDYLTVISAYPSIVTKWNTNMQMHHIHSHDYYYYFDYVEGIRVKSSCNSGQDASTHSEHDTKGIWIRVIALKSNYTTDWLSHPTRVHSHDYSINAVQFIIVSSPYLSILRCV